MSACNKTTVSFALTLGSLVLFLQQAYKGGAVDRLTDVKKYTGLHKDRFDPKTGRGKAREERQPVTDNSGYVTNYKLAGSYDKIQ